MLFVHGFLLNAFHFSVSLPPSLPSSSCLPLPSLCTSVSAGIKTTQDAKFYAVSAAFDKFSNEGKTVVIQFSIKHEQRIDCGGGYVKVCVCALCANCVGGWVDQHRVWCTSVKAHTHLFI